MANTIQGRIGNRFAVLRDPIASGAQGTIYPNPFDSKLVVKVYRDPPDNLEQKFNHIKNLPPQSLRERTTGDYLFAWIVELFYDMTGKVIGCVIPWIDDALLLGALTNPYGRPSSVTPAFLFHVAHEISLRLHDLHSVGYVIGDINLTNFLVTRSGRVIPIDLDSMQVTTKTATFRCGYGVYDLSPPELQALDFKDVDHTLQHDLWSGASILFAICMNDENPFEGHYQGTPPKPSRQERIEKGWWPYSGKYAEWEPPNGVSLAILPPEIQDLFFRLFDSGAFDPTARPSMQEWVTVLETLDKGCRPISKRDWAKLQGGSGTSTHRVAQSNPTYATFGAVPPQPLWPRTRRNIFYGAIAATVLIASGATYRLVRSSFSHATQAGQPSNSDGNRTARSLGRDEGLRLSDLPNPTGPPQQPVLWRSLKKEQP
jgi:DNA-binding helix-hairpin-helix protein with protein kinase domain